MNVSSVAWAMPNSVVGAGEMVGTVGALVGASDCMENNEMWVRHFMNNKQYSDIQETMKYSPGLSPKIALDH